MKINRRKRLDFRQAKAEETKQENKVRKDKERARRDVRMIERIKSSGDPPYTPEVMSWLSRKLEKPASRITSEDVKQLTG